MIPTKGLVALLQAARVFKYRLLSTATKFDGVPILHQPVVFNGLGQISMGKEVAFGVAHSPDFFSGYGYVEARYPGSCIEIQDNVRFNNNCTLISATDGIRIGRNCTIGIGVEIVDSDFHGIGSDQRNGRFAKHGPVCLGENVFLGSHVRVLKGVTIGDNSVIGNSSIVTRSIPPNVVAAGNPCKVLSVIENCVDVRVKSPFFVHSKGIAESANIGPRTRVWAFGHILPGAKIGSDCNICDHTFIENDVIIGDRVTVKAGVSIWDGARIEDDVFIGPDVAFTNDAFPRSKKYPDRYQAITIRRGASIGANATLLPGITIGECAMIGAGAVVTHDVPERVVVVGNPARIVSKLA
jgi:acetyltransferase-like isoleucine patch superfamily enzyme